MPSSRSAFRFVTLVDELVVNGGVVAADVRPRGVAPEPVLVLVICTALPARFAVRLVCAVAVFAFPRMKLPPLAASAVPDSETASASSATTIAGDGKARRSFPIVTSPVTDVAAILRLTQPGCWLSRERANARA